MNYNIQVVTSYFHKYHLHGSLTQLSSSLCYGKKKKTISPLKVYSTKQKEKKKHYKSFNIFNKLFLSILHHQLMKLLFVYSH